MSGPGDAKRIVRPSDVPLAEVKGEKGLMRLADDLLIYGVFTFLTFKEFHSCIVSKRLESLSSRIFPLQIKQHFRNQRNQDKRRNQHRLLPFLFWRWQPPILSGDDMLRDALKLFLDDLPLKQLLKEQKRAGVDEKESEEAASDSDLRTAPIETLITLTPEETALTNEIYAGFKYLEQKDKASTKQAVYQDMRRCINEFFDDCWEHAVFRDYLHQLLASFGEEVPLCTSTSKLKPGYRQALDIFKAVSNLNGILADMVFIHFIPPVGLWSEESEFLNAISPDSILAQGITVRSLKIALGNRGVVFRDFKDRSRHFLERLTPDEFVEVVCADGYFETTREIFHLPCIQQLSGPHLLIILINDRNLDGALKLLKEKEFLSRLDDCTEQDVLKCLDCSSLVKIGTILESLNNILTRTKSMGFELGKLRRSIKGLKKAVLKDGCAIKPFIRNAIKCHCPEVHSQLSRDDLENLIIECFGIAATEFQFDLLPIFDWKFLVKKWGAREAIVFLDELEIKLRARWPFRFPNDGRVYNASSLRRRIEVLKGTIRTLQKAQEVQSTWRGRTASTVLSLLGNDSEKESFRLLSELGQYSIPDLSDEPDDAESKAVLPPQPLSLSAPIQIRDDAKAALLPGAAAPLGLGLGPSQPSSSLVASSPSDAKVVLSPEAAVSLSSPVASLLVAVGDKELSAGEPKGIVLADSEEERGDGVLEEEEDSEEPEFKAGSLVPPSEETREHYSPIVRPLVKTSNSSGKVTCLSYTTLLSVIVTLGSFISLGTDNIVASLLGKSVLLGCGGGGLVVLIGSLFLLHCLWSRESRENASLEDIEERVSLLRNSDSHLSSHSLSPVSDYVVNVGSLDPAAAVSSLS